MEQKSDCKYSYVGLDSKPGEVRQCLFARRKFTGIRACHLNRGNLSRFGVIFRHLLTAEFQKHLGLLEQLVYVLM